MSTRQFCKLALLLCSSSGAFAQSSVTVSGTLDLSAARVENSSNGVTVRQYQLRQDGWQPNKIVFKGIEDLGDGLKAGFFLDAGINPDSGTANSKFWGRRSTVSLISNYGELRLGRDYNPTFWNTALYDPFGNGGVAASYNLVNVLGSGAATLFRADNSIGYFLPPGLNGFYGQVMVAAGEGLPGNKYVGGRVGMDAAGFSGSIAYSETDTVAGAPKYKTGNLGLSYDFGVAKVMGLVMSQKYSDRKQLTYLLGTVIPAGSGQIGISYEHANASGAGTDANDGSQVAVGYSYNLSKRTNVYATYAQVTNKGVAAFGIFGAPGSTVGGRSRGGELGLRHSF